MDIRNIVAIAGGASAIARASCRNGHLHLTSDAILKWMRRPWGIPEANWSLILELCGDKVTISDLHHANEAWRKKHGVKH